MNKHYRDGADRRPSLVPHVTCAGALAREPRRAQPFPGPPRRDALIVCGIAGQVTSGEPASGSVVSAMCDALVHRGPDSRGLHLEGPVGLGIQRLRVIDLETGDQPVYNEDGKVAVVLNGEIYNFRELRERLRRRGHSFATQGDTEVIVHLYEEHGTRCVEHLHGMFAFALWDSERRQLLLARDRVGKKPLFYALRRGGLSFASEISALLCDPAVKREVDTSSIDCFLSYQYVPAPRTAFAHVKKLPPATTLILRNGVPTLNRYWRLDYSAKRPPGPATELYEEIREEIREAVRRRLVADVPVGVFLSGGIDSSAVVAAMAEASSNPVKTFSIGFDDPTFDELPYARLVADRYETDHHELVVRPDAVELLPTIVRHHGEPFADASAIPTFHLAALARRHVTVALNGDGGDESFGGYTRYVSHLLAQRLSRLPTPLRRGLQHAASRVPAAADFSSRRNQIRRLLAGLDLPAYQRYARHVAFFEETERASLYTTEFALAMDPNVARAVIEDPWREASGRSLLDVMLEVDVETYLPGDLLAKMDVATMAHSLEGRAPLLDPIVMQLGASLPAGQKVRGLQTKVALRAALRGWIPDEVLDRPKRGFQVPLAAWLRGALRGYAADVLLDPSALERGYFRPEQVESLLRRHAAGTEDGSLKIWALLVMEHWHRELVDRTPS